MTRERRLDVWNVATMAPVAAQSASIDSDGDTGSWMCRRSKSPSASQRRTRTRLTGPNASRATEPLYFTGTARPAPSTYQGTGVSSSAGASTLTSWPAPIRCSARSRTWNCTPPGTSNEYGQTMPIRSRLSTRLPGEFGRRDRHEVGDEHPLQHVPVLRVVADADRDRVGARLRHGGELLGPLALRRLDLGVERHDDAPSRRRPRRQALVVQRHRV